MRGESDSTAAGGARLEALERRLRSVEGVLAIQALKARYGELVDSRYTRDGPRPEREIEAIAREIAALFTEDAVWDGGPRLGVWRGREEIARRFLAPTLRFTWHYFVKPRIEVDGDTARGRWDILAPCTGGDGQALWMAGVEEDEYRCVDGAWLHSRMQLRVVFMAPHATGWGSAKGSG
jgi:hypothetical protein